MSVLRERGSGTCHLRQRPLHQHGRVHHVAEADPLRRAIVKAAAAEGRRVRLFVNLSSQSATLRCDCMCA